MKYLAYGPILTVSALTGMRVTKLFEMIDRAHAARSLRVPTGELNNLFVPDMNTNWQTRRPAQQLEIRYLTQVSSNPPSFVVFGAGSKPLHFSSERFLVNSGSSAAKKRPFSRGATWAPWSSPRRTSSSS